MVDLRRAVALVPDDDYPDYAAAVAKKVADARRGTRGIVICGSGFGVDIVANKFDGRPRGACMSPGSRVSGAPR